MHKHHVLTGGIAATIAAIVSVTAWLVVDSNLAASNAASAGTYACFKAKTGQVFLRTKCATGEKRVLINTSGFQGERGYSNFELAQQNGFAGTVSAWLKTLVGPAGRDGSGSTGATGPTGPAGPAGPDPAAGPAAGAADVGRQAAQRGAGASCPPTRRVAHSIPCLHPCIQAPTSGTLASSCPPARCSCRHQVRLGCCRGGCTAAVLFCRCLAGSPGRQCEQRSRFSQICFGVPCPDPHTPYPPRPAAPSSAKVRPVAQPAAEAAHDTPARGHG